MTIKLVTTACGLSLIAYGIVLAHVFSLATRPFLAVVCPNRMIFLCFDVCRLYSGHHCREGGL